MKKLGLPLLFVLGLALAGAAAFWLLPRPAPGPAPVNDMEKVAVPSGQDVYFSDVIAAAADDGEDTVRFRFVAPAIAREGGTVTPEAAQADMQALCDGYALAHLPATGPRPRQIVISFSDRWVPFGQAAPEATQFFEAYRPENGKCIWEMF